MSLPLVRLSSLDPLRGFVAVGRRMSITQAADELCLTQSAVSRQIHALEQQLGCRLFVRQHRGVAFTPEGERLFRSADSALQQLQDVMGELRRSEERRPVTLTASVGVVGLWLLPRLPALQRLHPKIDLRLSAANSLADLRADGIDLALRYCRAADAPADAAHLFGETLAPVLHPRLAQALADEPGALARMTLLELDDPRPWLQWQSWRAALPARSRPAMLRLNQYDQVIHAALAGQGVALGRLELLQPLLASGQLACLPEGVLKDGRPRASPFGYWLLQAEPAPREDVRRVAAWIQAEARAIQPA
ncbi:LysR family transcriptional regulator [Xenophilus arseniciresistens]|uniref:LysR family transcriptional regulator n=1 Tax=Xenophilus arseniciresistens TaxID=1283306 RepID=A0AAE3N5H4_9BURK|nr:LysR family transcriptional regulator [Xenophilus arseniciresistens]MDA7415930.1 LysR family transcriptional regulator [Xenophilus arseniciresistens]